MKKRISVFILILFFIITATNTVFAADSFSTSMNSDKTELNAGEEVSIQLSVTNINMGTDGINVIEGTLNYNRDLFEEVTTSSISTEKSWETTYNNSNGKFLAVNYSNGVKSDVMILTIKLKTKAAIEETKEEKITISDITSNNGKNLVNIGSKDVNIKVISNTIKNEDDTTAKGIIPQTGSNIAPIIIISIIFIIALIGLIKYRKLSKILMLIIPLIAISSIKVPVKAVEATGLKTNYYKINDKIISRVEPKTTVSEFKNKFYTENNKEIKLYSDNKEVTDGIVKTGMNAKYGTDEYDISVVGDIDRDGDASKDELAYTIRHILGFEGAEFTPLSYTAADITNDSLIDQRDITKYVKFVVNEKFDLDKKDETPPVITMEIREISTNSITAEVSAIDREEGLSAETIFTFYIKELNEPDFTEAQSGINKVCNFRNLKDNTTYIIKVETTDKAGNKAELTKMVDTNAITTDEITIDNVTYNLSTNKVKARISTLSRDYTLQYSIDKQNWTDIVSGTYIAEQPNTTTIYARLYDGTNGSKDYTEYTIKFDNIANVARPGDYIRYNPTEKTYILTASQSGYDTDQVFNSSLYNGLWQVLYNDSTNGFQIISADSVADLYLNGKVGYNNSVSTLNTISRLYENNNYTVENSGRSVGTNPTNPATDTTETLQLAFENNGSTDSNMKVQDNNYEADFTAMNNATNQSTKGIASIKEYYWTPSRRTYSDNGVSNFNLYTIDSEGTLEFRKMNSIYKYGNEYEYGYPNGIRPIVTLKDTVVEIGGNGTSLNPYILPNVI